ncbi:hypothetical protein GO986_02355 [Deinococcus sp. HMF7620]|uniref:Uncharacterized protein n=1 Tax=Deinococcus arboris TaxID=2682977 RepID=A0A7C9LP01_9DEIO|nr:hypothetical protein [Deinococcus arboris]MVN85601.1 hypothetical protein [Deinococcus arboris]
MKKLHLPTAMLGLTVLLTACPQPDPPQPPKTTPFALTVNLTGVSSAPVKVTNITTNIVLNEGALASGKTFSDLSASTVLKIEPGAVNGYTAPAAQTVTLDANKTVTLEYKAVQAPGNAVKNDSIQGTVTGIPYAGKVVLADFNSFDLKNVGTLSNSGTVGLSLTQVPTYLGQFLPTSVPGCTFTGTASANPNVALFSSLDVLSAQDDLLASITETVIAGASNNSTIARLYSASAATIKGTISCGGVFAIDLTLQAGWNAAVLTPTTSGFSLNNITADIRTQLRGEMYKPSVTAQLPNTALDFTANDTVTVPVSFYQDGAFNGQVSLSTDVPGLTVEPTTLTLPTLSTQSAGAAAYLRGLGLAPQRVTTNLTFRYNGGSAQGSFRLIVKNDANIEVGGGSGTVDARRPGIGLSVYDTYNLVLRPEKTLNINVNAQSMNGFSGDVTFSATDLPAGVTVTPVTKSLSGFTSAPVTLQAAATVAPGTYKITMTAEGKGGVRATTKVDITVPKPGVTLSAPAYSTAAAYQGSESTVSVDVRSIEGFTGATTVTLTDLPAGVSATAKSVNVTPGATTTVQIPIQVTADAPLGTITVRLSSPDLVPGTGTDTVQLTVRPARKFIGTFVNQSARANEGVWISGNSTYNSDTNSYTSAFSRFTVAGEAVSTTLSSSPVNLVTAEGGVVVLSSPSETSSPAVFIDNAGAKTNLPALNVALSAIAEQTDTQGRVWLVRRSSNSSGYVQILAIWTPSTGAVQDVQTLSNTNYTGGRFALSPDGKSAVYLDYDLLKINTVTSTVSPLTRPSMARTAVIANTGTVWTNTYGELIRFNDDGTQTKYNFPGDTLAGFDAKDPTTLWSRSYGSIIKFNTSTGTSITLSFNSIQNALPSPAGGLYVINSEYTMSGSNNYYLSLMK